jgi:hypothetical protein
MKMIELKDKYEGQALAITMVVLVVSALIGLSIYSRSMKDRMLTLEERASAEALEVSDLAIERLTLLPIEEVAEQFVSVFDEVGANLEDGVVLTEGGGEDKDQVSRLFRNLGIIGDNQNVSDLLAPICPPDQGGNEYELTLKTANEDTFYEVRAGNVWSIPARDILKNRDDCALEMNFAIRGESRAGFVISRIYCHNYDAKGIPTSCDKYETKKGHVDKYCFSSASDRALCNDPDKFYDEGGASHWIKFNPEEDVLPVIELSGSNDPSEVRIKAVGGTIGISYSLPEGCIEDFRMFQLRATANCQGVYRGKEILIPEQKWHETIFDYVIFNGEGSLP